jgi:hypothetical protein
MLNIDLLSLFVSDYGRGERLACSYDDVVILVAELLGRVVYI